MKLKFIVESKDAIVRLTEKRFSDYKKLREIVRLRKAAEAEFEFYCDQEKKAVETYGEKTDKGISAEIINVNKNDVTGEIFVATYDKTTKKLYLLYYYDGGKNA